MPFFGCSTVLLVIDDSVTGLPEDTAAHKGMSMGAAKMLKRLLPVLDRTFQQFPHYDLIITGIEIHIHTNVDSKITRI